MLSLNKPCIKYNSVNVFLSLFIFYNIIIYIYTSNKIYYKSGLSKVKRSIN